MIKFFLLLILSFKDIIIEYNANFYLKSAIEAEDFGEFFTTKPFLDGLFIAEPGEAGTSN